MGKYNQDPNEVKWDRSDPHVPFIDRVMQSTTFKWSKNVEWRPVPLRFRSSMTIVGYEYGASTVSVRLKSPDGYTYRSPVSNLFKILELSQCVRDEIPEHDWKFTKKGNSYVIEVEL